MKKYANQTFDEERALYGEKDILVENCRFDGPADGESAFKEGQNITVKNTYFNLRYPFWHDEKLVIKNCEITSNCQAAFWYSQNIRINDTRMHGIRALRECSNVEITGSDIVSSEFGWSVSGVTMKDSSAESEYFMLRSEKLRFENVRLKGKYAFQYISDSIFENCNFDTEDAFWHAKNVIVRNSVIKGACLAWYCRNVTFENCTITGTQPLCYCRGLKLVNCRMIDADLCFERSEVDATIIGSVISIKNPLSGTIYVDGVQEIIMNDPAGRGIITTQQTKS